MENFRENFILFTIFWNKWFFEFYFKRLSFCYYKYLTSFTDLNTLKKNWRGREILLISNKRKREIRNSSNKVSKYVWRFTRFSRTCLKVGRRGIHIQRWSPFEVCKQEPTNVIAIDDRSIDRSICLRGEIAFAER